MLEAVREGLRLGGHGCARWHGWSALEDAALAGRADVVELLLPTYTVLLFSQITCCGGTGLVLFYFTVAFFFPAQGYL